MNVLDNAGFFIAGVVDNAGPFVAAIIFGLPAAAYAAVRVIRRDSREDSAIAVVERSLTIVEKDRDYWRERAQKEQAAAEEIETRLTARMRRDADRAANERQELYDKIEDLRRQLHAYMLSQSDERKSQP